MNKSHSIISNSSSKKSLVICTPYFENIGGTEIEVVTYAVFFYDKGIYDSISIFSAKKINTIPFNKLLGNRNINIFNYPYYFSNRFAKLINEVFLKFGCEYNIFEYIYWKYQSLKFSTFFILTYTKSTYFFSIIKAVSDTKMVIGKITMGLFTPLPNSYQEFYKRFDKIIVFNDKQKDFWDTKYNFHEIVSMDIMIPNEVSLLKTPIRDNIDAKELVFGFLGRIASEKNIMDMILLIDFLNNKNKLKCKLIIQGEGDLDYENELHNKVSELELSEFVIFNNWFVDPLLTHEFYEKIDVFLVTSFWEGGPITSLEAVAAGRLVLGYDVGAMSDRFKLFPFMINKNFNELCGSALEIVKMDSSERSIFISKIRIHYLQNLSNNKKEGSLLEIINK
jgi:glycosyltransferase involved in cell wall biosynthesis